MTHLHKPTLEAVFEHMTPTTLAALIADFDEVGEMIDADGLTLMQFAIDALFINAGAADAFKLLSERDVNYSNPLVAAAVDEYTQEIIPDVS